ncbi:hypothetical protein P8452_14380 [Trifolium repens]|nr:hypothetical protein P8452_14380 [Trifolium repens]
MMNSFWWGHSGAQNKGIHWLYWDKLSVHKNEGGMGFKNLTAFNLAMLSKQGWKFMTNHNSLVSRLFKARYFPHGSFLNSTLGHNPSFEWRSICNAKFIIRADKQVWRVERDGHFSVKTSEDSIHLFFLCRNINSIWRQSKLSAEVAAAINVDNDAAGVIFNLLQRLNSAYSVEMATILWSIWKQRNNKVWNNTLEGQNFVIVHAQEMVRDWTAVQRVQTHNSTTPHATVIHGWKKPLPGRMKCNIDASFVGNKVGIGMCIRDDSGAFICAKTEWFSPRCTVHVGEALGFLSALRQANEVAHTLARAATSLPSLYILVDIPHCIENMLINEMS